MYKSMSAGRRQSTPAYSGLARRAARNRSYSGQGGAMLAASYYRGTPRRPRRKTRGQKLRRRKAVAFKKKVRRAVGRKGPAPKWHIFRSTAKMSPTTDFTATGQATMDVPHGHQTHFDGLVALQAVATQNVQNATTHYHPQSMDRYLNVQKSYMVLFITNNSATSVYGKMAVFKPRKGINDLHMWPSKIASDDLNGKDADTGAGPNMPANEWISAQSMVNLGNNNEYNDYLGLTDMVGPTNLTDMGWIWQNSPAFKRYYKGKIRTVTWAPMECKKFTFKMKKRINIDTSAEYTMRPATGDLLAGGLTGNNPAQYGGALDWMLSSQQSGFSEMHPRRGFFVSFLLHGIPARADDDGGVGLTQPKMDMYWLNAYKYSWSSPNRREFHVSTPNPLGAITPFVAIPGFGTAPGAPQVGG